MNHSFHLKSISLVIISILSVLFSPIDPAHAGTADAKVKAALDKAGLQYQVTGDGDFKVLINIDGKRTQQVVVFSNIEKINGTPMEIREIFSFAYKGSGTLSADIANKMMKDSRTKKIGAWELVSVNNGATIVAAFDAKIPADTNAESLVSVIQFVAISADLMEKEVTNKDDF
jgi:hypothetical protein